MFVKPISSRKRNGLFIYLNESKMLIIWREQKFTNFQVSNWYLAETIKCYLKLSILLKNQQQELCIRTIFFWGLLFFPLFNPKTSVSMFTIIYKVFGLCILCCVYSHCNLNPQQPQLSPSFSQLHRKWSDNVCMMHILNTLAICSSASVQRATAIEHKKNLTEKKVDGNHLTSYYIRTV